MQDDKLLTQYAYDGSEAAFGQLVARHLTLVYSTCLRETGSPSQAEDAAQVFSTLMGDVVGNYWEGEWQDAQTGKEMTGRGTEFWTVRDGKVAVWEATFNVWEKGGGAQIPIM